MDCGGLKINNYGSGQGIASSKWKYHNRGSQLAGCTERSGVILASFPGLETERARGLQLVLAAVCAYTNYPKFLWDS